MFNLNSLDLASAMVARSATMGGAVPTVFAEEVASPSSSIRVQTVMIAIRDRPLQPKNQQVDQDAEKDSASQA